MEAYHAPSKIESTLAGTLNTKLLLEPLILSSVVKITSGIQQTVV
jgi:hypothetical protein